MRKVFIKTYGCQMNERDSEAVAANSAQISSVGGASLVSTAYMNSLQDPFRHKPMAKSKDNMVKYLVIALAVVLLGGGIYLVVFKGSNQASANASTEESNQKRKDTLKKRYQTEEHHSKGKPLTEEQKIKLSLSLKGRQKSEETKMKMKLAWELRKKKNSSNHLNLEDFM